MQIVCSWGRTLKEKHKVIDLSSNCEILESILSEDKAISYGMGKSYGDVCLNPNGVLFKTRKYDNFISFDETTGVLHCEAGLLLSEIQELMQKRGWILPVTPGTQLITVGGAIASDVHGKNHHVLGTFGHHLESLKLLRTSGEVLECSPNQNKELFYATIGGCGLTGIILEAKIKLKKVETPWVLTENIAYQNIDEFIELSEQSKNDWEYIVSWADCVSAMGRGIFMRGRSLKYDEYLALKKELKVINKSQKKMKMFFNPPFSLINKITLKIFNQLYYNKNSFFNKKSITHFEKFLYPLDSIYEWNRIYGNNGFFQYQCVVPLENGKETMKLILREISKTGFGSFLAVLKVFGEIKSLGMLSFPRPGITLALDFPNFGEKTLNLFRRLDSIVEEAGGCLYLAKDACMSKEFFQKSYPQYQEFLKYKDPNLSSSLSRRLMGV
jgi:FAD/FMN-containing dehydrogenase